MSRIRANSITNKNANGAPDFPNGLTVTGIVTATVSSSTLGSLTVSGDATIGGNLGVAGTVTYEDVARIDATGISTFREGFKLGPLAGIALTAYKDGSIRTSGIITASTYYGSGANLTGIDATKIITGNTQVQTIDTGSDGHVKALTEGAERLRIDSAGRLLIGKTSGDCKVDIDSSHYVVTSSGKATTGINIDGTSGNANEYGGGISFQCGATGAAAVAAVQNSSDADVVGLAFFTHPGTTGSDNAVERLRIGSAGQIGLAGANYGTAGQVLKSGGANAAVSWGAAGGITHIDHWHKASNQDGTSFNPVTGWNRTTNAKYGNLNSQMTEASGIFTFPATGLWFVSFQGWYYADARATRWFQTRIHATQDNGSNWEQCSDASNALSGGTSANAYNSTFSFFIFDVTNVSNCKVKFTIDSQNTVQIMGGKNFVSSRFIRVGDT